jgi:hypothetical protein
MEADRIAIDKEANALVVDVSCNATYCGNPMRVFIPLEDVPTLLTTRRQLEIAMEALNAIRLGNVALNWSNADVCVKAIDAIKKEGE